MHEVHSYIWSDVQKNRELGISTPENVKVINAQTPDHQYIRISMLPTLLSFTKENKSYSDSFGIFEIGHTVDGLKENGECNELKNLGAVFFSHEDGEEATFLKARDAVRELCSSLLHKAPTFESREARFDFEHPVNTFNVNIDGKTVGYLCALHPTVSANIDKKCALACFEIILENFSACETAAIKYSEPSKFPAIDIDLTFNANIAGLNFDALTSAAKSASALLSAVSFKDVYGEGDTVALTLRFTFVSNERTLTKQELADETKKIEEALAPFGLTVKA